jgi:hypothetical protein
MLAMDRMRSTELFTAGLLIAAVVAVAGCSFSASSESSSDSSVSSSASSASSSPASKETGYRNDVRDFTAAYVKSGGRVEDFKQQLGQLAQQRGITNWEENPLTYDGIGRGLAKAKASVVELQTYTTNLAGSDATKAAQIKAGYDAEPKD